MNFTRTCSLVAVLGLTILSIAPAAAEFIKMGPLAYQSGSVTKTSIAVVPTTEPSPGIFIAVSINDDGLPVRPENLTVQKTLSAFLAFDQSENRFWEILVGGNRYQVRGNLALLIGKTRVSIDHGLPNPFVTVSSEFDSSDSAIVGFVGLSEVFRFRGDKAIEALDASRNDQKYRDVIPQYQIDQDYRLSSNGQILSDMVIGNKVEFGNPCLLQGSIILDEPSSSRLLEKVGENTAFSSIEIGDYHQDTTLLERLLLLKITEKRLAGVRYETSGITFVTASNFRSDGRAICLVSSVNFGDS